MKTPFLHLARRLATATPPGWFPACLLEATGYLPAAAIDAGELALMARADRLRPRDLASTGALYAAPGLVAGAGLAGGLIVLPSSHGELTADAADRLRRQLAGDFRRQLDAALADPRLLAHLDLGAAPASIAGAAGLQFLRDRHAVAVGHYVSAPPAGGVAAATAFDTTSLCVQIAGLPASLVLWLAATIAAGAGAARALVLSGEDDSRQLLERQRPPCAPLH